MRVWRWSSCCMTASGKSRWNRTSAQTNAFRASSWLWQQPLERRARDRICRKGRWSPSPAACSLLVATGYCPISAVVGRNTAEEPTWRTIKTWRVEAARPQRLEGLTDTVLSVIGESPGACSTRIQNHRVRPNAEDARPLGLGGAGPETCYTQDATKGDPPRRCGIGQPDDIGVGLRRAVPR